MYFLIAHAANRISAVLDVVVAVDACGAGVQLAVVRTVAIVLGSAPEKGGIAKIEITAVVKTGRKRTEACGIVATGIIANSTGVG